MSAIQKSLLVLPNGTALKYARPYQGGKIEHWHQHLDRPEVWTASKRPKQKQYRAHLWSSNSNFNVVAADFDSLPPHFSNYYEFFEFLQKCFSKKRAVVSRSASGKVKVFLLVKMPRGTAINQSIALETLKEEFKFFPILFQTLDKTAMALKVTYLSNGLLEPLVLGLPHLVPIKAKIPGGSLASNTSTTASKTKGSKTLKSYGGSLAEFPVLESQGSREKFIRILLECKQLVLPRGWCISTLQVAKNIGVSQQRASAIRANLVRRNWLKPLANGTYKIGHYGKRFVAAGPLEEALKTIHRDLKKIDLPKSIPNGEWHRTLGELVGRMFYFCSRKELLSNIESIPGAKSKDRLKQAADWYSWYETRRGAKREVSV